VGRGEAMTDDRLFAKAADDEIENEPATSLDDADELEDDEELDPDNEDENLEDEEGIINDEDDDLDDEDIPMVDATENRR
jgi:hypothetical protein